jgi:hypothetical protein
MGRSRVKEREPVYISCPSCGEDVYKPPEFILSGLVAPTTRMVYAPAMHKYQIDVVAKLDPTTLVCTHTWVYLPSSSKRFRWIGP